MTESDAQTAKAFADLAAACALFCEALEQATRAVKSNGSGESVRIVDEAARAALPPYVRAKLPEWAHLRIDGKLHQKDAQRAISVGAQYTSLMDRAVGARRVPSSRWRRTK
jgi:hypothetical protein